MPLFLAQKFLKGALMVSLLAAHSCVAQAQSACNTLPAPNHTIDFGYVEQDHPRYPPDSFEEVSPFTDLYYNGFNDELVTPPSVSDWLPRLTTRLARAQAEGKKILLSLNLGDPTLMQGRSDLTSDYFQALSAMSPYWGSITRIEVLHEPDFPQFDAARIDEITAKVNNSFDGFNLGHRPLGITVGRKQIVYPDSGGFLNPIRHSNDLAWIGVEAFLCGPNISCGSSDFPQGTTDTPTNRARLANFLDNEVKPNVAANKQLVFWVLAFTWNAAWPNHVGLLADFQDVAYLSASNDPRVDALLLFSYTRGDQGTRSNPILKPPHLRMAEQIFGLTLPGACPSPPSSPTLTATALGLQVSLSWNDTSQAETGYELQRQDGAGAWATLVQLGPNSTAFVDPTPNPPVGGSVTLSYRVRATSSSGNSSWSNVITLILFREAPTTAPAVVGPQGCVSTLRPTYQWGATTKTTRYYLTVTRADIESFFINDSNLTATSYPQPTDLAAGVQYRWKVKACNNIGCGPYTSSIYFTPYCAPNQAPALISPLGCVGTSQPTLTWSTIAGATQYKVAVYRVVDVTNDVLLHYVDVPTASFTPPSPLTAGQEYRFKVKAKAGTQDGPFSRHRYFTPLCSSGMLPGTASPMSPWFAPTSNLTPTFTWEIARGASEYYLRVWSTSTGAVVFGSWVQATTVCSGTDCSSTPPLTFAPGGYAYQLQTRNSVGTGPWGPAVSFTVP